jgi:mannose-1-phosphate guanylyltransferase
MIDFHRAKKAKATIALTPVEDPTSYGLIETTVQGRVTRFLEKPGWEEVTTNMINAGTYVLEPEIVDLIPENQSMHMTDLLLKAKKVGFRVQIYPMTCSWFDVGEWGEYKRALEHMAGLGATA